MKRLIRLLSETRPRCLLVAALLLATLVLVAPQAARAQERPPAEEASTSEEPAVDIEPLIPDGDLLDKRTWLELVDSFKQKAVDYAPRVTTAAIVFALFLVLAWIVSRSLVGVLRRTPADDALASIASRLAFYTVMILGLIMAAAQAGLEVGSLLAGVGVVGLAIGLAAQESLGNVLAGLTILWERPFRMGDWVTIAGEFGEVSDVQLRTTVLTTAQGLVTILPNRQVIQSVIVNHTANPSIRLDVPLAIAYREDSRQARTTLLEAISELDGVASAPAAQVVVTDLGDSSVNLELRAWIENSRDERRLRVALVEAGKIALDEAGIEIPFPQRTVHIGAGHIGTGQIGAGQIGEDQRSDERAPSSDWPSSD